MKILKIVVTITAAISATMQAPFACRYAPTEYPDFCRPCKPKWCSPIYPRPQMCWGLGESIRDTKPLACRPEVTRDGVEKPSKYDFMDRF